jgi:hypothetical protein
MGSLWLRLSLLGLVGVASLALIPIERFVSVPLSVPMLRLVLMLQPGLLVLAFTAVGMWASPRVGLDAPLVRAWVERRPVGPVIARQVRPALLAGLATAGLLVAYGAFSADLREASQGTLAGLEVPFATRVLYGGIAEELISRWGMMSLFVWICWRLAARPSAVPAWCFWMGAAAAALLFALGHVPVLYALVDQPSPALLAAVIGGNALPGLLFGWLFWRRGLEAAMLAHASAHLVAAGAAVLVPALG